MEGWMVLWCCPYIGCRDGRYQGWFPPPFLSPYTHLHPIHPPPPLDNPWLIKLPLLAGVLLTPSSKLKPIICSIRDHPTLFLPQVFDGVLWSAVINCWIWSDLSIFQLQPEREQIVRRIKFQEKYLRFGRSEIMQLPKEAKLVLKCTSLLLLGAVWKELFVVRSPKEHGQRVLIIPQRSEQTAKQKQCARG